MKRGLLLSAVFLVAIPAAKGQTTNTWTNTGTGSWFVSGNWTAGIIPTPADDAEIDNGGTAVISETSLIATASFFTVGNADAGSLQINGGSLATSMGLVGVSATSQG